jgi:hypothetical protein
MLLGYSTTVCHDKTFCDPFLKKKIVLGLMCSRGYMGLAGTKIKLVQILVQAPVPDLI